MNRFAVLFCAIYSMSASAAGGELTEQQALRMVRQYSQLVACDVSSEFKSVKLDTKTAPLGLGERGAAYLVVWHGDVGCLGGSGTNIPYFSLVNLGAGNTPIINVNYPQPKLDFRDVRKAYIQNGMFIIEGMGYGPRDGNCCPTKPEISAFELIYSGFKPL